MSGKLGAVCLLREWVLFLAKGLPLLVSTVVGRTQVRTRAWKYRTRGCWFRRQRVLVSCWLCCRGLELCVLSQGKVPSTSMILLRKVVERLQEGELVVAPCAGQVWSCRFSQSGRWWCWLAVSCQDFGTPQGRWSGFLGMNATDLFGSCIPGMRICVGLSELHTRNECLCQPEWVCAPFGLCDGSFDGISATSPKDALLFTKSVQSFDYKAFDFGGHPWFVR